MGWEAILKLLQTQIVNIRLADSPGYGRSAAAIRL